MDDISGSIFSIFLLPIAGCESAVGLALMLIYSSKRGTIVRN